MTEISDILADLLDRELLTIKEITDVVYEGDDPKQLANKISIWLINSDDDGLQAIWDRMENYVIDIAIDFCNKHNIKKGFDRSLIRKIEEDARTGEAMLRCFGDGPCVGPISDEDLAYSRQQARKLLDEINKNKRKK